MAVPVRTILLVDDEERILTALERSLRREGYRLLVCSSPRRALQQLASEPVDLILTDHKMPGMTGLELLAEAAVVRPEAARLLITGWSQAVSEREIAELDIRAVIPKPWENAELKRAIRSALEKQR